MAETDPNAKGLETSEGKLTIANVIAGVLALVAGVSGTLLQLRDTVPGLAAAPWVTVGLTFCGVVLALGAQLGWTKNRTNLKIEQVRAATEAGERAAALVTTNEDARRALAGEGLAPP